MSNVWHPDDDLLIPWLDGELDRTAANRVAQHLSGCRECGERLSGLRAVNYAVARLMPPPPAPWADLRGRLKELDAGQTVQRGRRPSIHLRVKWIGVAAALIAGAVVIRLSTTTVSAAELLRDASVAETRADPPRRIRVKTRRAVFTRPASGNVESDVAHLFRQAGYSWEEPLSARSFSGWRNRLSKKDDRVRILTDRGNRFYRVVTSTEQGTLAEASITLRGADLRAINSSFRFRNDEMVDIAEEADAGGERLIPPSNVAGSDRRSGAEHPPVTNRDATPSDELRVLAALHAIAADLGEPVEITREKNAIRIIALVTDPERQAQIRTALSGVPLADLRFEQPEAVRGPERSASAATAPKTNALIERLAARLGGRNTVENFTNHVMDLSEAALARALALHALAARFPAPVESKFSEADARTLASIQSDHASKLLASVRQLSEVLKPLAAPQEISGGTEPFETWQSGCQSVLDAAKSVDRTLTNALAGSGEVDNPDEALSRLARAAAGLNTQVTALQITLARYGAQR